jgi:hypothetical protein
MRPDDVAALAAAAGFADIAGQLAALARPSLRLEATDDDARLGGSRLGGAPDFPADLPWPRPGWSDEPMSFIAQLDLSRFPDDVWPGPAKGLLSFFCARSSAHGGVDSPGSACVVHIAPDVAIERREPPPELAPELVLRALAVEARPELTLPTIGVGAPRALDELGFGWDGDREDDYEQYVELQHRLAEEQGFARYTTQGGWAPRHRLLGWPRQIQDDVFPSLAHMSLEAEGAPSGRAEAAAHAADLELLLQVETDRRLETDFGDGGSLYFALPARDLAGGRFGATQAIVQSG